MMHHKMNSTDTVIRIKMWNVIPKVQMLNRKCDQKEIANKFYNRAFEKSSISQENTCKRFTFACTIVHMLYI